MRNLVEYPITKEEIIDFLADLAAIENGVVGDIGSSLLNEAIKHVRGSTLKLSDLGTVQDSGEGMGSR